MTRAADAELMAKVRRGEIITPEDHITTIDTLPELQSFVAELKRNGRWNDEAKIAALRRQKQIGESHSR